MKINKKLLTFGLLGIFALAFVTGAIIQYYGQTIHHIDVESPVSYIGDAEYTVSGSYAGVVLEGNELGMINNADFEVLMQISDNTPVGIGTTYKGDLELTKKTVDFNSDVWEVLGEKVQIEYTIVGDEFSAKVVTGEIEGYELIYYKDAETLRFDNPEKAIRLNEIVGNLPYAEDGNAEEYDYCSTLEYNTCHGAKIWYVPSSAIDSEGNIAWGRASEFYFESSLIQYNSEGEIIVYPNEVLDFTPEFDVSLLFTGAADIRTRVTPITVA